MSTDPLLAVAWVASRTRRLKLGVNLVPFGRSPYLLARDVAQLDRLSAGRLLVTLVPGLDAPGERLALGITDVHRGRALDALLPMLRAWWAGAAPADPASDDDHTGLRLAALPVQQPLEVWLGGAGPEAIRRAGRLADGWLGSIMPTDDAARVRAAILAEAEVSGRAIDLEHFGLSLVYARSQDDLDAVPPDRLHRAGGRDIRAVVPIGADGLRATVAALVSIGLSKFVVGPLAQPASWVEELAWLAKVVLPLQS
jgi:alkanesulfonate monooxygenase SsuD/methylene tetrahydromethanopterin reductase-like flavin-dependent oxidoreductase (luciferase family)